MFVGEPPTDPLLLRFCSQVRNEFHSNFARILAISARYGNNKLSFSKLLRTILEVTAKCGKTKAYREKLHKPLLALCGVRRHANTGRFPPTKGQTGIAREAMRLVPIQIQ